MVARRWVVSWLTVGAAVTAAGCNNESGVSPPVVASVLVSSPLGSLWDVGASVQLAAAAQDAQGNSTGGATFTWSSSNPAVVTVAPSGLIDALAVGAATIRAETGGVGGSLTAQVVDADAAGIGATAADAYVASLVGGTTSALRAGLQTGIADCSAGATEGNLERVQGCIGAVRTGTGAATDPTDRALTAVLALFVDRIERLLNL